MYFRSYFLLFFIEIIDAFEKYICPFRFANLLALSHIFIDKVVAEIFHASLDWFVFL